VSEIVYLDICCFKRPFDDAALEIREKTGAFRCLNRISSLGEGEKE